jgi:hypothetical protein
MTARQPRSAASDSPTLGCVVSVADFLVDRFCEELKAESCIHERDAQGAVRCLCERPTERAVTTLTRIDLVRWCEGSSSGAVFLRLFADAFATHPDYRPEWHRLPS